MRYGYSSSYEENSTINCFCICMHIDLQLSPIIDKDLEFNNCFVD